MKKLALKCLQVTNINLLMHIFDTVCYAYIKSGKKLDTKCKKSIFKHYDKSDLAYHVRQARN